MKKKKIEKKLNPQKIYPFRFFSSIKQNYDNNFSNKYYSFNSFSKSGPIEFITIHPTLQQNPL